MPTVAGSSLEHCPATSLLALVLGADEPDRPLGRIGRRHEFAQGVEDLSELVAGVAAEGVVVLGQRFGLVFQLGQPLGQVAALATGSSLSSIFLAHVALLHIDFPGTTNHVTS